MTIKKSTVKHYCECGCGKEIPRGDRYHLITLSLECKNHELPSTFLGKLLTRLAAHGE